MRARWLGAGIIFASLCGLSAETLPTAVTAPQAGFRDLLPSETRILVDRTRSLTAEEVRKKESEFRPGFPLDLLDPSNAYWVSLDIDTQSARGAVLEARSDLLQYIDIYYEDNGQMVHRGAGVGRPFLQREIAYRFAAFSLPPARRIHALIRIEFRVRQHVTLKLWDAKSFTDRNRLEQLIFGLYYGAVIAMAIYNLFVFLSLRSVSYLYYVLYIVSFAAYQTTLNGISSERFWPSSSGLDVKASFFLAGLSILFAALFARHFLGAAKRSRGFNAAFLLFAGLAAAWSAASLFLEYQTANVLGRILGSAVVPVVMAGSIWALRDGYRPARYFLLAWSFFLVGVLLFTFTGLGLIPWSPISRYSMQIGSVVEILLLSLALGDRINSLRDQKDDAVARTREMEAELQIAKKIQNSILPQTNPVLPRLDVCSTYKPASEIGGDFYDFHSDRDRLGVLVADVCGHGVPAALIASMVKVTFANLRGQWRNPGELMSGLQRELAARIRGQFITACYVFIEPQSGRLHFASAGHPPVVVYRRRESRLIELKERAPVIGWTGAWSCSSVRFALEPGDRIVLYTDGIFEQRNARHEMFGFERFHAAVTRTASLNAKDASAAILGEAAAWHGDTQLDDDVTLLVMDVG